MSFRGEYEHSLDQKNRVVLPSALRKEIPAEQLGDGLVGSIGRRARNLTLEPKAAWNARVDNLFEKYDPDDEEAENYIRDLSSGAFDVELDKQFRFVLPDKIKQRVKIDKDIVFVGMVRHIEVWDAGRYAEWQASREGRQEPPKLKAGSPR